MGALLTFMRFYICKDKDIGLFGKNYLMKMHCVLSKFNKIQNCIRVQKPLCCSVGVKFQRIDSPYTRHVKVFFLYAEHGYAPALVAGVVLKVEHGPVFLLL